MREIEFRAWDKVDKIMVDVHQINWELGTMTLSHDGTWHNDISRYELLQFTGLRDRTGNKIYEGYIVIVDGEHYQVKYAQGEHGLSGLLYWLRFCDTLKSNIEVIGNIFENPELLP
jgi:hypothetical protein